MQDPPQKPTQSPSLGLLMQQRQYVMRNPFQNALPLIRHGALNTEPLNTSRLQHLPRLGRVSGPRKKSDQEKPYIIFTYARTHVGALAIMGPMKPLSSPPCGRGAHWTLLIRHCSLVSLLPDVLCSVLRGGVPADSR